MGKASGKDLVLDALNFNSPERTPRDLWWLDAVELFKAEELKNVLSKYPPDIKQPNIEPKRTPVQKKSSLPPFFNYGERELCTQGNYIDEWGCIRYVAEDGVTGEVREPIIKDLDNVDKLEPPWRFLDSVDVSNVTAQCRELDQFMISGVCARPFERLQLLRGTENLYKDIYRNRDQVLQLLEMIHEYNIAHIKKWLKTDVDGIFMMDDWGAQHNLLLSPEIWRKIFKPLYQEYVDLIHTNDKYAFFHSDGWIRELYPDVIEIGIDAINSQLFTMDIEQIGKEFGGKLTFWGEIDRQSTLPFGNPAEVKKAVYRVRKAFEDYSGGLIAQCEWGKDNPKKNIETVFEAWEEPLSELYN